MTTKSPALKPRGRRFFDAITTEFDPSPSESELLLEAARTIDLLELLAADEDPRAIREARQQRLVLGRLLAQLQIPADRIDSPTSVRARHAAESRWAGHLKAPPA